MACICAATALMCAATGIKRFFLCSGCHQMALICAVIGIKWLFSYHHTTCSVYKLKTNVCIQLPSLDQVSHTLSPLLLLSPFNPNDLFRSIFSKESKGWRTFISWLPRDIYQFVSGSSQKNTIDKFQFISGLVLPPQEQQQEVSNHGPPQECLRLNILMKRRCLNHSPPWSCIDLLFSSHRTHLQSSMEKCCT